MFVKYIIFEHLSNHNGFTLSDAQFVCFTNALMQGCHLSYTCVCLLSYFQDKKIFDHVQPWKNSRRHLET